MRGRNLDPLLLRGRLLWKLDTRHFSAQGKHLSGTSAVVGKAGSLGYCPPRLCCWGKLLSPVPRGGVPQPRQSGFTVKCLQAELGGSCPGTLRTRSYPHLLFSSETQPRAEERAGLVRQTELGSTSGLGICNPREYSEPQSVHLCNGVIATCRG